ncbi:MAG: YhfC family glutamic-type intramembrane protease [Brevefilum sp.]
MMVLLIITITISLLITIGLPILAGFWLNNKFRVPWRVITYGALGYFIVQALVTLVFSGFNYLVQNDTIALSGEGFNTAQIFLSVFLGALLGVLVRWLGMKYMNEDLDNLEAAYGIGAGYGGAESIMLVGLPLLMTFITMLANMNIDPQTSNLDPAVIQQIEELWQVSAYIPLVSSLERIAAFVMHITVTILILQVFTRESKLWLLAAFGLELFVNGLIVGLAEMGLDYGWVILVALVMMVGNLYILFRLRAFEFDITRGQNTQKAGELSDY